jgi:DNA-binding transcriptional ArsR family regulator
MNEEKITIDRKTFKTLASETRINILKSLDQRRKTLSELAKELGLSVSTVKEHMDSLLDAELICLKDDGHKWKYYELTRKGSKILHPGETRIWILICASALGIFLTAYDLLKKPAISQVFRSSEELALKGIDALEGTESVSSQVPIFHIVILIVLFAVFFVSLIFWIKNRSSRRCLRP